MAIYRRKGTRTWYIRFTTPGGRRIQCSARTEDKQAAQRLHDQLKADIWRQDKLGEKPRRTWKEAVTKWVKQQEGKSSLQNNIIILRWLQKHLDGRYLDEIDRNRIEIIAEDKERQGVKGSTVNKTLDLIRNILRTAHREWGWLDTVPVVKRRPEPNGRVRWLTPDDANKLIALLPEHQRDITIFALATGLRHSNVVRMRWEVVDMRKKHAYVEAINSKSGKPIPVPLNRLAMEILNRRFNAENKHKEYVFTYQGRPIKRANTRAFKSALKAAGIEDFRWHDLRHTWASWHVTSGTNLHELQIMGGWAKTDMVQRYAHLSSEHLKKAANRISGVKLVQLERNSDLKMT